MRYSWSPGGRFNIAHDQQAPVVTAGGERTLRWGMLSPWRGHGGKRPPVIYEAPRDAIDATPVLRNALRKQRCLVRADGFFAWRTIGKKRQAYWIHGEQPAAFAGLWSVHRDDDVPSFAIVIVPAAPRVAQVTDTMPLLADAHWLDDASADAMLSGWRVDAVSSWVDDPAHDDATCITPLNNPAQGELF